LKRKKKILKRKRIRFIMILQ